MVGVVRVMVVLVLGLSSWTALAAADCSRIVAVGDLHGAHDPLRSILVETDLVGDDYRWRSDDACLVLLGDLVDRGEQTRRLLDYVMDLERQADGRLHVLIGNHEIMNVLGDLRYVTGAEFAEFADDETKKQRQKGYRAFTKSRAAQKLDREQRKEEFARSFPPGWFAHRRAFAPDGKYGAWILSNPVLLVLEDTLFVHGGVEPSVTSLDLEELNEGIVAEIIQYDRLRAELVEAGWLSPLVPFGASFDVVEQRLSPREDGGEPYGTVSEREIAGRFLDLKKAWFVRSDGPLWTRKLANEDEESYRETLDRMLEELGVERIVVGHTTQDDGFRIGLRFGGRVFLTDTGAGPYYGGRPSALEISDETVRAVYLDEIEVLVPSADTRP